MSIESDEERAAHIKALLHELAGYEARGDQDGISQVTAELDRLSANAKPPAKRAATRRKA